jgi:hypothetical protein
VFLVTDGVFFPAFCRESGTRKLAMERAEIVSLVLVNALFIMTGFFFLLNGAKITITPSSEKPESSEDKKIQSLRDQIDLLTKELNKLKGEESGKKQ